MYATSHHARRVVRPLRATWPAKPARLAGSVASRDTRSKPPSVWRRRRCAIGRRPIVRSAVDYGGCARPKPNTACATGGRVRHRSAAGRGVLAFSAVCFGCRMLEAAIMQGILVTLFALLPARCLLCCRTAWNAFKSKACASRAFGSRHRYATRTQRSLQARPRRCAWPDLQWRPTTGRHRRRARLRLGTWFLSRQADATAG